MIGSNVFVFLQSLTLKFFGKCAKFSQADLSHFSLPWQRCSPIYSKLFSFQLFKLFSLYFFLHFNWGYWNTVTDMVTIISVRSYDCRKELCNIHFYYSQVFFRQLKFGSQRLFFNLYSFSFFKIWNGVFMSH